MQPKKVDLVGIKTGPDSTDKIMTTTDNPARIAGRPVTETFTTLPVDRGEGQGTAGNKIADGGWEAGFSPQYHVDDTFVDNQEDNDAIPALGAVTGDGTNVLQEYRGFKMRGAAVERIDPNKKDLFTTSPQAMNLDISYFSQSSLGVAFHRVWLQDTEGDNHIVNFNRAADGLRGINQCAIDVEFCDGSQVGRVVIGKAIRPDPQVLGLVCNYTKACVYIQNIRYATPPHKNDEETEDLPLDNLIRDKVIAHESGHHIHISHYNWQPLEQLWDVMVTHPISYGWQPEYEDRLFSDPPWWYDDSKKSEMNLLGL